MTVHTHTHTRKISNSISSYCIIPNIMILGSVGNKLICLFYIQLVKLQLCIHKFSFSLTEPTGFLEKPHHLHFLTVLFQILACSPFLPLGFCLLWSYDFTVSIPHIPSRRQTTKSQEWNCWFFETTVLREIYITRPALSWVKINWVLKKW